MDSTVPTFVKRTMLKICRNERERDNISNFSLNLDRIFHYFIDKLLTPLRFTSEGFSFMINERLLVC